ncbi:MAG: hypothetical protein DCF16_16205 [Alphaproteobacteria bacterium]|nr:MAG: hypothetical protein DCF16_16205 [Alphaproteobacteria bacterium]
MQTDRIIIFSSHSWAYGDHRDGLHDLLSPWRKNADFIDHSVPAKHPLQGYQNKALARELVRRISQADIFFALAGMYANQSDWMKREIDWAFAHDKYIIPLIPHHQQRVSRVATDFGSCAPVHWRSNSVKAAIFEALGPARAENFAAAIRRRNLIAAVAHAALNPPPRRRFPHATPPLVSGRRPY